MEQLAPGDLPADHIAVVLEHFRVTTGPLTEAARRITNAEPTFSNACIRNAFVHLARVEGGASAPSECEQAMFQLLLADLNCLKISISDMFEMTGNVMSFIADDDQPLARGARDRIKALKMEAATIIRQSSAEWDIALAPTQKLSQGGLAVLERTRENLIRILSDGLRVYEALKDRYNVPEHYGPPRDAPHVIKKFMYGAVRDNVLTVVATIIAAVLVGMLGNLLYDTIRHWIASSHSLSFIVSTAYADTGQENPPARPPNIYDAAFLFGLLVVLVTCLFLIVRKGTDKTTIAWARDLIKMIIGVFIGHLTKFGG